MGSSPRVRGKQPDQCRVRLEIGLIPARAGKTWSPTRTVGACGAHPRACGENLDADLEAVSPQGSSPRVRGKPHGVHNAGKSDRLIPARAGKTIPPPYTPPAPKAHPRACGENWQKYCAASHIPGSSPRVRGKRIWELPRRPADRLIPARAGKTNNNRRPIVRCYGSSPRVRGKPSPSTTLRYILGLIPARAGKTPSTAASAGYWAAHPRACGENEEDGDYRKRMDGSSPRVRGKLRSTSPRRGVNGLIPARAGKTEGTPTTCTRATAHPRACGENRIFRRRGVHWGGSSPRVRGKRPGLPRGADEPGLIPARAGKTRLREALAPVAGAHPRACGENLNTRDGDRTSSGSSPRVRGKLRPSLWT